MNVMYDSKYELIQTLVTKTEQFHVTMFFFKYVRTYNCPRHEKVTTLFAEGVSLPCFLYNDIVTGIKQRNNISMYDCPHQETSEILL